MHFITSKGQVTIPKEMRDAVGIRQGDGVSFYLKNGEIIIRKDERKTILSLGAIVKKKSSVSSKNKKQDYENALKRIGKRR